MLFGILDIAMNNGLPPLPPVGDKDETISGGSYGDNEYDANDGQIPYLPIAHVDKNTLDTHVSAAGYKRNSEDSAEMMSRNKYMKVAPQGNNNAIPGWGYNRRMLPPTDSALLLGPIQTNPIMQKYYINDSLAASSMTLNSFSSGNDGTLHAGELLALREQLHRNDVVNSMALARLLSANMQHSPNRDNIAFVENHDRPHTHATLQHQLLNPISASTPLNQRNNIAYGGIDVLHQQSNYNSSNLGTFDQGNLSHEQVTQLIRHLQSTNDVQQNSVNASNAVANSNAIANSPYIDLTMFQVNQASPPSRQVHLSNDLTNLDLPLCIEGKIKPYNERPFFALGISEDPNWLSEFHCFVRSDLVEVFRASNDDITARNNSITYHQVGFRCRFCAHLPQSSRSGRSSAFPSSLRQMYQSLTMMLRDHFASCEAIPSPKLVEFNSLKDKPAQGATDSKRYWLYAAQKLGMTDTKDGIMITPQSRIEGINLSSFGTVQGQAWEDDAYQGETLVRPTDRDTVSEFLFLLLSQVQPIRLTETECIGNRRSLQVGLPGFGCRYCCNQKRLGLCRMFPARRRTLPHKVNDLYDHLRRCNLCPQSIKDNLEQKKMQATTSFRADQSPDKEFFDRVWSRLGHSGVSAGT